MSSLSNQFYSCCHHCHYSLHHHRKSCKSHGLKQFFFYCFDLRFVEKGNLEVQLFILTSKLRANHQKMYTPPENKALSDINKVCYFILLLSLNTVTGLSEVADCWQKSLPTWLVSADYSVWQFFTDGVFNIEYPWTGCLL